MCTCRASPLLQHRNAAQYVATRCKCCNVVVRGAGMCVPAGLFMPTMFVGAKFGGATGFGVYWFLEHVAGQSALAQTIQPVQP